MPDDRAKPGRKVSSTAFKPGVSGNPKGRAPVGMTLAEKLREKMPPGELSDLLCKIARTSDKDQDRLKALQIIADRGYPAPPIKLEHSGGLSNVLIALPPAMSPEAYAAFVAGALRSGAVAPADPLGTADPADPVEAAADSES